MTTYSVTNTYNEIAPERTAACRAWVAANCPSLVDQIQVSPLESIKKFTDLEDVNEWINYSLTIMTPPAASSQITEIVE